MKAWTVKLTIEATGTVYADTRTGACEIARNWLARVGEKAWIKKVTASMKKGRRG